MAKITVASIKQQIAALEAKAQRIAADEMKLSVSRVRSLMDSLGVTLEHLGAKVSTKVSQAKKAVVGKKLTPPKRSGAGAARYRDPATGVTWSGFGRAPGWIASAANRDDYLVSKAASAKAAKKVAKRAAGAGKRVAAAVKKSASKAKTDVVTAVKPKAANRAVASAKKPAKKSATAKPAAAPARKAAKKAASRKAGTKKVAASAPVASSSPVVASANE